MKTIISKKGYPVPVEMRPIWRISLIIMCISIVSGERGYLDLKKVNILVWMLIRKLQWEEYENFLENYPEQTPVVSVDTAQYTAVELCISKGFVTLMKGRLYIEDLGKQLQQTLRENDLMQDESDFLERLGKKLTENKVNMIIGKK